MALRKPELVLIDVDGTLVDSVPDLAFCVDETMTALDLPRRGEQRVRQWVGNGAERLIKRALTNDLHSEPEEDLLRRAMILFFDCYAQNVSDRSRLYPGVREGLRYLQSADYRLGSVTNKPEAFTLPLLKDLDILSAFEIVVSGDVLPKKKPDPMPLLHAASELNVSPERSLMLGDSKNDVQAARAAGFQVVCTSYGYNHGEDIRAAEPDAVIDSMIELKPLFEAAA